MIWKVSQKSIIVSTLDKKWKLLKIGCISCRIRPKKSEWKTWIFITCAQNIECANVHPCVLGSTNPDFIFYYSITLFFWSRYLYDKISFLYHYGRFWEILSQKWGMNFCSCGFIFILFPKILTSKAQNTADHVPSVKIFEIETKLHLQGLNLKLEFWDKNLQNWP